MGMMQIRSIFFIILLGLLFIPSGLIFGQGTSRTTVADDSQYARRFQNGAQLYELGRWQEAAMEFRRAQEIARTLNDWSESLFWGILSTLAFSDYYAALRDMDALERHAPNSHFTRDMVYHRARVYYIQGFYEDALFLFNRYNESVTDADRITADRRAAAYFWMGECLFSMVQYDEAEKFFSWVIARYPNSPKVEAASYRIDLIKHKKIEAELLALLQLSHEESLRTSEDYQRTIRTYENILNIYQRRIQELTNSESINQQVNTQENNFAETSGSNQSLHQFDVTEEAIINNNVISAPVLNLEDDLLERAKRLESQILQLQRMIGE